MGRITSEFRRGRFINSCAMSGVLNTGMRAEVGRICTGRVHGIAPDCNTPKPCTEPPFAGNLARRSASDSPRLFESTAR